MSQLRVGFFTEIYRPVVNGVVASVETLAQGLRARGHTVSCFAPSMPGAPEDDAVFRLPSLPLPTNTRYRLTLPLVGRRNVNNVIKRLDVMHVHSLFVTGWAGLRYARRYGMPIVYTYHTQLEAYAHYVPFEPNATRFAAGQLTRAFGNLVDAVVVPTPAVARHLRELGVQARIEVVPTGIDVERFGAGVRDESLRKRLGVRAGGRLIALVSRLAREKNVDVLLRALASANDPSMVLAIAGDGPQRDELQALAVDLRVAERVVFLGVVARDELPNLYASADAFVFPSTSETQGLVQAEALAAGSLVIAADAAPNREVLGEAARIVAPSPAAFARALGEIPARPDAETAARAKAAARRFSAAAQVEAILGLYRSLVDSTNIRSVS
ncbi:MAG TPA: glycosyltransferase [Candidatus Acidoferrales bacterium]|nr:glycosyltransferase [Candidatus Acidoferrales bacterium]